MQDQPRPSSASALPQAHPIDTQAIDQHAIDGHAVDRGETPPVAPAGRPYGLIGLTAGLILILLAAAIFCLIELAAAFGIMTLVLGHQAIDRLSEWRTAALGGHQGILQAFGVILSLAFYAAVAVAVLAAARLRGGRGWRDVIGWHAWHPFRRSWLFWTVALGAIAYNVAADTAISHLYPPSRSWVVLPQQTLWATLFVGLAVVFAPIAEELLFRGWLYTGLRLKIGALAANLVSASLFALAHWESTHIYALAVFPVGLALGFIREMSGSLKASMAFHAVYNAAASALLVLLP